MDTSLTSQNIQAHRAPVPEDEPLPGEEPVPQEDPVPDRDPVVQAPSMAAH